MLPGTCTCPGHSAEPRRCRVPQRGAARVGDKGGGGQACPGASAALEQHLPVRRREGWGEPGLGQKWELQERSPGPTEHHGGWTEAGRGAATRQPSCPHLHFLGRSFSACKVASGGLETGLQAESRDSPCTCALPPGERLQASGVWMWGPRPLPRGRAAGPSGSLGRANTSL